MKWLNEKQADLASAAFVLLLAVLLLLGAVKDACAEDLGDHNTQVHLLAHAQTGTMAMLGAHWLLKDKLKPWQVLVCGVTVAMAVNATYEALNPKPVDQMAWRVAAAGVGAFSVGFTFAWYSTK